MKTTPVVDDSSTMVMSRLNSPELPGFRVETAADEPFMLEAGQGQRLRQLVPIGSTLPALRGA